MAMHKKQESSVTCRTRVRLPWNSPHRLNTHACPPEMKKPVRKRKAISIQMFTEKAEMIEVMALRSIAKRNVVTRPQVSARKPTAWELSTTPRNPAEASMPC